ncbi:hypothetical protein VCRA2119O147_1610013 [Vibrio crassostreae]|nr:hypothetical protein VCRA2118O41_340004 [Vibrio crassostreae]CAK2089437.1 hypothetical protein VCRA2116O31_450003 [Vibrio crassostreae]CAK2097266.1 hypothetical protein VCRA2117O37_480003 [Vibrio crassostreae]CAK2100738.1 hypothetical protein VCRA2113O324_410027 [Vibrio crassostreae]CAK2104684.1 hypothetical protein VCRA2116O26_490003 [Vibrio crassostreae]
MTNSKLIARVASDFQSCIVTFACKIGQARVLYQIVFVMA